MHQATVVVSKTHAVYFGMFVLVKLSFHTYATNKKSCQWTPYCCLTHVTEQLKLFPNTDYMIKRKRVTKIFGISKFTNVVRVFSCKPPEITAKADVPKVSILALLNLIDI